MAINNIKKALQSEYVVPSVFLFAFVFWLAEFTLVNVCAATFLVAAILLFCDDVKNIFCPILYVGFFIKDIVVEANWSVYFVCIAIVCASFAAFVVRKAVKDKNNLKLGKMFFPLILLDVAFLLGGIIGNFVLTSFFATLGLSCVMLLLYFIAVNFTENLGKYFAYLFVCGAAFIVIQRYCYNLMYYKDVSEIFSPASWVAAEPPNTSAIYVALGAVGCLVLGTDKKYGFLMLIPCVLFGFYLVTICCRGILLTCLIVMPPLLVYYFIKSKEKKNIIILVSSIIVIVVLLEITTHTVSLASQKLIEKIRKAQTSGRLGEDGLWMWCLKKFKEYPIFGFGFKSSEQVPCIRPGVEYYIHAHNTLLQWAVSCGVVGLILAAWFYFEKYKLVIAGFKSNVYIPCFTIVIAMSGVVDQAAAMDPFVFLMAIITIVAIEQTCVQPSEIKKSVATEMTAK